MPKRARKKPHKPVQKLPPRRAKVDREVYEKVLIFYVNNGLKHAEAVKEFGLSRRTLSGLYYQGAPHLGLPKMKDLVNTVEWRARALRASAREEELAKADAEIQKIIEGTSASTLAKTVDDVAQARAEEGLLVQSARQNILKLQRMLAPFLNGALKRAKELERLVQNEDIDPWDLLKLLRELAKFQNDLASASKLNFEQERMLMGQAPDQNNAPMGTSDAVKVLELGARTLNRLKAQGRIIDGEGVEVARLDTLPPSEPEEDAPLEEESEGEDEDDDDEEPYDDWGDEEEYAPEGFTP